MNAITKGGYQDVPMSRRRAQLLAEYAERLATMLENAPDDKDLAEWVQSKIDRAASAIQSAYHYLDQEDDLEKARSKLYDYRRPSKRINKKTGRREWDYFYTKRHGGRVSSGAFEQGAAFRLTFKGRKGHFHIDHVEGDMIHITHDAHPDKKLKPIHRDELRALLKRQNRREETKHLARKKRVVDKLKRNPTRKRSSLGLALHRLRQAAEKAGVTLPEEYQRKPKKKTAREAVQGQDNFEGFNSTQRTALTKIVSELEELQRGKSYSKSRDIGPVSVQNKIEEYISSGFLRDQGLSEEDQRSLRGLVSYFPVSNKVFDHIKEKAAEIDLDPETMRSQLETFVSSVVTDTLKILSSEADDRQSKGARLALKRFETPRTKQEQAQHFFDVLGITGFKGRRLSVDGDTARVDIKGKDNKIGFVEFTEQGVNFDSMPELKEDQKEAFNEARENVERPETETPREDRFDTMPEVESTGTSNRNLNPHRQGWRANFNPDAEYYERSKSTILRAIGLTIEGARKHTHKEARLAHEAQYNSHVQALIKLKRKALKDGFDISYTIPPYPEELKYTETPREDRFDTMPEVESTGTPLKADGSLDLEKMTPDQIKEHLKYQAHVGLQVLTKSPEFQDLLKEAQREREQGKRALSGSAQDRLNNAVSDIYGPSKIVPREQISEALGFKVVMTGDVYRAFEAGTAEEIMDAKFDELGRKFGLGEDEPPVPYSNWLKQVKEVEQEAYKREDQRALVALKGASVGDVITYQNIPFEVRTIEEHQYRGTIYGVRLSDPETHTPKKAPVSATFDVKGDQLRFENQPVDEKGIRFYEGDFDRGIDPNTYGENMKGAEGEFEYAWRTQTREEALKTPYEIPADKIPASLKTEQPPTTARDQLTSTAQEIITEADQDHDERHDEHQSIEQFELGEHTHTRTGVKLFTAKQKGRTDRDEYRRRVEIAKKHNGRYERRYVKGFLFKTAEDARNFALEVEGGQVEESAETVTPHEDHPQADNFETMVEVESTDSFETISDEHKEFIQTKTREFSRELMSGLVSGRTKRGKIKSLHGRLSGSAESAFVKLGLSALRGKEAASNSLRSFISGKLRGERAEKAWQKISALLSVGDTIEDKQDILYKQALIEVADHIDEIAQGLSIHDEDFSEAEHRAIKERTAYLRELSTEIETVQPPTPPREQAPEPDPSPARQALTETADEIMSPSTSALNIDQANALDSLTENRTRNPESKATDKALIESARELAKTSERGDEIRAAVLDLMNAQQLKRYKRATGETGLRAEDMIEKRRAARERLRGATSGATVQGEDRFDTMPEVESTGTPKTLLDDIRSEITVERFMREGRRREDTAEREVKKLLGDLEKLEQGLLNREYSTEAKRAKAQEILNRRLPKILEQVRHLVSAKLVNPQLSGGAGKRNAARYHRALGDIGIAEDRANEEYRRTLKELDQLEEPPPQTTTPREQLTETARETRLNVKQVRAREAIKRARGAQTRIKTSNRSDKLTKTGRRARASINADKLLIEAIEGIINQDYRGMERPLPSDINQRTPQQDNYAKLRGALNSFKSSQTLTRGSRTDDHESLKQKRIKARSEIEDALKDLEARSLKELQTQTQANIEDLPPEGQRTAEDAKRFFGEPRINEATKRVTYERDGHIVTGPASGRGKGKFRYDLSLPRERFRDEPLLSGSLSSNWIGTYDTLDEALTAAINQYKPSDQIIDEMIESQREQREVIARRMGQPTPTTAREQLTETAREVVQGADNFETMPEVEFLDHPQVKAILDSAERIDAIRAINQADDAVLTRLQVIMRERKQAARKEGGRLRTVFSGPVDLAIKQSLKNRREQPEREKAQTEREQAIASLDQPLELAGIKPSDLSLEDAISSYRGTSWSYEKRGEQELLSFKKDLDRFEQLGKQYINIGAPQAAVAHTVSRTAQKLLTARRAMISARSRTMSTMITGRGNFPVRSQQKRMDIYDKRVKEYLDIAERGIKELKKLDPSRPQPIIQGSGESAYKEKLLKLEALQEEYKRKRAEARKQGLRADDVVPRYLLTNNNAQIRRVREQIKTEQERQAELDSVEGFEDFTLPDGMELQVERDQSDNRLRLHLSDKPSQEVREKLKRNGYKWSRLNSAWQRQLTQNALSALPRTLAELGAKKEGAEEPPPPEVKAPRPSRLPEETQAAFTHLEKLLSTLEEMETQRTATGRIKGWYDVKMYRNEFAGYLNMLMRDHGNEVTTRLLEANDSFSSGRLFIRKPPKSTATEEEVGSAHGERRALLNFVRDTFEKYAGVDSTQKSALHLTNYRADLYRTIERLAS